MRLVFAVFLALSAPGLTAQSVGRHDFDLIPNLRQLTFGGQVTLLGISAPLNGNPASFAPGGAVSADVGITGGAPSSIRIVDGDDTVITVPTLNAVVPNPVFSLPPLANVQVLGLTFEIRSENAVGSPMTAPVTALGSFSTEVVAEVVTGIVSITGTVNQTISLAGLVTTPRVLGGLVNRTAQGLRANLGIRLAFSFTDPASGVAGTITLDGGFDSMDRWLAADKLGFAAATGGTQSFRLSGGAQRGNEIYVLLGSGAGTSPGTNFGPVNLPLNFDGLTGLSIAGANMFPYANSNGFLDVSGFANASFTLPAFPALQGLRLDHAYVVLTGSTVRLASNAVRLELF